MARIGGRSTWFAWLVGLVCAGLVATLVVLAVPLLPAVVDWSGQALRGDLDRPRATPTIPGPTEAATAPTIPEDCRALYPDDLWGLLSTASGVALQEDAEPATVAVAALPAELEADPRLRCRWEAGEVSITTALATVGPSAPELAGRVLTGEGFVCSTVSLGLRCERTTGSGTDRVTEVHTVREGVWLATVMAGWEPPQYASVVEGRVWPA